MSGQAWPVLSGVCLLAVAGPRTAKSSWFPFPGAWFATYMETTIPGSPTGFLLSPSVFKPPFFSSTPHFQIFFLSFLFVPRWVDW